jgi:DNA-binding transcriptional LysR family regulator
MEMIHLQYFIAVARHKSFTKAAAASHVSQSVVSKLVKDLEREVGFVLFERTAKKVALTDAGAIFLAEADKLVTMFANLTAGLDARYRQPRGKITIGLPLMADAVAFAQLLGEFRGRYPEIETELHEAGSKKIEQAVRDGQLDAGIICRQPGDPEIFGAFAFAHDPLQVVVHPRHRLAGRREVSLGELAREPFIMSSSDFSLHDQIIKHCDQAGFLPRVVLETSQRELMIQTVAINLGVALIPKNVCDRLNPSQVRAIPLVNPEIVHSMSVIWRNGRPLSYAAKLYLDFVRDYLAEWSRHRDTVSPPPRRPTKSTTP